MSRPPVSPAETATPEPETNRGLEDPRTIHPSPENVFPEAGEMPPAESSAEADTPDQEEDSEPDEGDRGIVDPRNEPIGPDI
jgi:hypothetical protein